MQFVKPIRFEEAITKLGTRGSIGSDLTSSQWRDVPVGLRERAFFSARVESVRFLDRTKGMLQDFLSGNRETLPSGATALKVGGRAKFVEMAREFAIKEGMGPLDPRDKGTVKDITSQQRLQLIFDTQTRQAQDFGYWQQGQDPDVLDAFPAQRFVRERDAKEPRDWHQQFEGMVRLKSDLGFWRAINRDFNVPWGPWGWGCGHDVEDVDRQEAEDLGLLKPGEPVSPVDKKFNDDLQASTRGLDPELMEMLKDSFGDQVVFEDDAVRWASKAARTVTPEITGTLDELATAYKSATSAKAINEIREQGRKILEVPQSERVAVQLKQEVKPTSTAARVARGGADIVSRYTAKELLLQTKVTVRATRSRRAYHLNGGIYLGPGTDASTAAHEIAHAIEQQNPKVLQAAAQFLLRRGAGEKPKQLRKLTGVSGYRPEEIALEDKWKERNGSVYAGKLYSYRGDVKGADDIRATEVLTMGIERLHADPLEFYTNDREWFEFVVNTLKNR